jgi:NADH-quinone oxidoreductase subunit M
MAGFGILSCLTFLPLVGVAFILTLRGNDEATWQNARYAALITTLINMLLAFYAWAHFDTSSSAFQFVEEKGWFGAGLVYKLGVDGMSFPFIVLTAFLMPFCILASWQAIQVRVKEYLIAFLVLETLMIGVFGALDLVLFYLFFEGGLIPMFLIIGIWGGKRRIYASFKFFLYTLTGSLLMLLAIMAMYGVAGTTDITVLLKTHFPPHMQTWLWLAFFASFAVKMPMWPVHTWLPDAHVEAPTAGSVILAGILLKMGGYGFLRFSLPMFPDASVYFAPLVYTLSVIAIVYTSLVALVQEDMKKLIAYSSVAHMGFVTMGLFSFTEQGIQGAIFQMVSHGIVSAALFLCVGVVYDRMHTREISAYGGLVHRMPKYAVAFMIFTLANVGLPGTSGFVGEFLTLLGMFRVNSLVTFFAATGVILSAAYALYLYRRVVFGVLDKESLKSILDIGPREIVLLAPLAALTIFYGFHPSPILNGSAASVSALVKTHEAALADSGKTKEAALADSGKTKEAALAAPDKIKEAALAATVKTHEAALTLSPARKVASAAKAAQ